MINKESLKEYLPSLHRLYLRILNGPVEELRLTRAFLRDYRRFRKYSYRYASTLVDAQTLSSVIIKYAHSIEKAFTFEKTKLGFGKPVIVELMNQMRLYSSLGFDENDLSIRKARSVLAEYLRYHKNHNYSLGSLSDRIIEFSDFDTSTAGTIEISRDEIQMLASSNFESCAASRSSIRMFGNNPVPDSMIESALRMATRSPSACNRQSWRTYVVRSEPLKANVLALQNGNRGFGEAADVILVVCSDIRCFAGVGERSSTYVDGGLYAMSLIYSLHSLGLGTCPLNWSVAPAVDLNLRKILPMEPSENVIMMIAVGTLPAKIKVAKSARESFESQATFL